MVWNELLAARGLMPDGRPLVALTPSLRREFPGTRETAAFVDARRLASARLAGDAQPPGPWRIVTLGLVLTALAAAGSLAVTPPTPAGLARPPR